MPANWNPRRAGKAPKYTYRFTVQEVARAAGRTVAAVQKARERGKFNPRDLRSLAAYVMGGMAQEGRPGRTGSSAATSGKSPDSGP